MRALLTMAAVTKIGSDGIDSSKNAIQKIANAARLTRPEAQLD